MLRRGRAIPSLVLLLALISAPAFAATASLVTDLNPGLVSSSLVDVPQDFHAVAGRVVFVAGNQLWASDGTAAGTGLLEDFGSCGHFGMRILGVVGGRALFNCVDLWSTDGTAAGTVRVGAPFPDITSDAQNFTLTPLALSYTACDDVDCKLWRSDGTPGRSTLLALGLEEAGGVTPHDMTALGNTVFFVVEAAAGRQLWISDGTVAGTRVLATFHASLSLLTAVGTRLLFFADDGARTALWTSDGTAAGTRALFTLKTAEPFVGTTVKALGTRFYFVADDGTHGPELWQSDGTPATTRAVTNLASPHPFSDGLRSSQIETVGGRLLFVVSDGTHSPALWTSGGPGTPAAPLAGCPGGCPGSVAGTAFVRVGSRIVFADAAADLWATDGTGAGTVRLLAAQSVSTIVPFSTVAYFAAEDASGEAVWRTDGTRAGTLRLGGPAAFFSDTGFAAVAAAGKVFFSGANGSGFQLWATEGTPVGTHALTTFGDEGAASFPADLAAFGGGVLFTAFDGGERSIWQTAGTAATTEVRVAPGSAALPSPHFTVTAGGGRAVFIAPDPTDATRNQLWATDGTLAHTQPLTAFGSGSGGSNPTAVVSFAGKALAAVVTTAAGTSSTAFWTSDGTAASTLQLFSLPAGVTGIRALTSGASGPGRFYFLANDAGLPGAENLWQSDGTLAGTRKLTNQPHGAFTDPQIVTLGSTAFFRMDADTTPGPELWKTDGTPEGTLRVPGRSSVSVLSPSDLFVWNGGLYFFAAIDSASSGRGLFRTDGTTTVLLENAAPFLAAGAATPAFFTPLGNSLFFAAGDGVHGTELWKTDGTAAGTTLVRDIAPGIDSSNPTSLVAGGGLVYFAADDGEHGIELWQSDGIAAGTRLVQDLAPGAASAEPDHLTVSGSQLFFTADDGLSGTELWVYPLAGPAGCQPSATVLCLSGGRFQVEAVWRDFSGNSGVGHPVSLTADTGYFWFFDPANVETVIKVLDGRTLNQHFWTFYGALSSVDYMLTVTDTQTGAARRYVNPPGTLASVADTSAFGPLGANATHLRSLGPAGTPTPALVTTSQAPAVAGRPAGACVPGPGRLCLSGGRFAVEAIWTDFSGHSGVGTAVSLTADTGYFWFFDPANVEAVLKVLDGRTLNGKFWVFYGALSSVQYILKVTDTVTGVVKSYANPSGRLASVADTGAF